ncbi:MAG: flagellar biosynthetic protein FliO, partial [Balneolaceae bacterium]
IGLGSQLKVVEINGEIWVLGLATGSVSLLHRYQPGEWKERDFQSTEKVDGNFLDYFKSKL